VAHRGASGYLPEETLEAYTRAIELGADVIEMDLASTKDGVLITRHDPNLALNTDVATRPEFASRKKTMQVDGETQTGWFSQDFTLAEIKTLGAISTDAERPQQFNGRYKIPTFQEILDLAAAKQKETGRPIAIYPETKNPTWFRDLGLPLEDKLIAMLDKAGLNSKAAPVFVQSFEPGSLKYMKGKGLKTKMVQLIDGDGIDPKTGAMTYAVPVERPWEWTKAGDKRTFAVMVTPAGLAEIATYADGIGPDKSRIIANNAAGKPLGQPTSLIPNAHRVGLLVHPFTFRPENNFLAADFRQGDPASPEFLRARGDQPAELKRYYELGVDGLFADNADTAVAVREKTFGRAPSGREARARR
jgi:glycerophosphoryl diester phosphodiesterase